MGLNLNNVLIGSDNPVALVEFYTKVLGDPCWQGGDWFAWRAGQGLLTVGPYGDVTGPTGRPGRILFGFHADDVVGEFERITALGAQVVRPPYHPDDAPNDWLTVLADPDGNYLQIWDNSDP